MKIFAIESSCDDTCVAIISNDNIIEKRILKHLSYSQTYEHSPYAGVVPELAARAHLEHMGSLINALNPDWNSIDAIAATCGPGLIGGLIIGALTAKSLACALNKPFIAVNHLEGHLLTPRLSHNMTYPYLTLLTSGGHCQFVSVHQLGQYEVLGKTLDDAAGEAFDKIAKMLNIGFPGGPALEKIALLGDPYRFKFPTPLSDRPGCDFSFSGLKTSVLLTYRSLTNVSEQDIADIAASAQHAIIKCLVSRTQNAFKISNLKRFSIVGGVAANTELRLSLNKLCNKYDMEYIAPPLSLCTDNAAMIGWAAMEHFLSGKKNLLDYPVQPRWPLEVFFSNI